ncbi:MAG: dihydrolipoamide acetyltransferase family protein [Rickettsiella sp.]|nr:dihydrolipoamide acetyltransferase family protein [Rickettsiella sp.]
MTLFYLPDLGEGLPDAEIRHWYINVGDIIKIDQPMLAMETAKAVVDIPAPFSGKVIQLFGKPGDIIKIGKPLLDIEEVNKQKNLSEKATVVGNLQTTDTIIDEAAIGIKPNITPQHHIIKATPSIRALAKKMQVDLTRCVGSGPTGQITVSDLENAVKNQEKKMTLTSLKKPIEGYEPLHGVRRAMAIAMSKSHQSVVPVTLVDDADIHAWPEKTDVTLRVIQAIKAACQREPRLNAWFNDTNLSLRQHHHINLGIAIDTSEGLFVAVIKDIAQCSATNIRDTLNRFKSEVKNRNITPEEFSDATFVLSNVGVFGGTRYATPIVTPPMVAILAVGRITEAVVPERGKPAIHKLLPLSLTVDHRAITGGEAARFLSELIKDLQTT